MNGTWYGDTLIRIWRMLSACTNDDNRSGYPQIHIASETLHSVQWCSGSLHRKDCQPGTPPGTGWFLMTRCPHPLWRSVRRSGWRQRVMGYLFGAGIVLTFSYAMPGLAVAPCAVGDFQFSCRIRSWSGGRLWLHRIFFREICVKGPGRTLHRYHILPETIEAGEENTHKHRSRVGSFQPQGGEPYRLSV